MGKEHKGRYKLPWVKGRHGYEGRNATVAQVETDAVHALRVLAMRVPGTLSLGLRLPAGVLGFDIDAYEGKGGAETLRDWEARYGPLPATYRVTARVDGVSGIRLYRIPIGFYPKEVANSGIEFLDHHHRYLVAPPSWHHTGNRYALYLPDGTRSKHGILPPTDSIPLLPQSYLEGLPVQQPGGRGGAASAAEVKAFDKRYWQGPQADVVPHVIRTAKLRNPDSVRNAVRDSLCFAAREAKGGRYGFANAVEQIQLWAQRQYAKAGRQLDPDQFESLVAYAVGQVANLEEGPLRAKWDRTACVAGTLEGKGNDK
ncbi:bifunctional DNA primase/polymerase [Mycolicibacterium brisbanense]|nr:bifunctional DNA primase/polymerase [Mycolicibacterium brisbanense]